MQTNNPTVIELIQTVSRFLSDEVQAQLTGSTVYNNKIAINVLNIIERELLLSQTLNDAEHQRLKLLLEQDLPRESLNERLIAKISKGELDSQSTALMDHLYESALGKLSIDNPRYARYKKVVEERKNMTDQD